jgi:hypothetical protein
MDLTSALKSEAYRPLATAFVPGAAAIAPYVLLLNHYQRSVEEFGRSSTGTYVAVIVLAALAVGLVLEDLGSRIEGLVWDALIEKETGCHSSDWWAFLYLAPETERIGHRYLRTITLRLKFELGFGLALIALWFGVVWLDSVELIWSYDAVVIMSAVVLGLASYLLWEAYGSVWLLARLRHLILCGEPCRMEARTEDPARKRNYYDRFLLVSSIGFGLWAIVLTFTAFASDRMIGRDSGFMSGVLFGCFSICELLAWWWIKTDADAVGRRRGLCLRFALAFSLLGLFVYVRMVIANPPLSIPSFSTAIAAAALHYGFARTFWSGSAEMPASHHDVLPTLPDAA